MAAMITRMTNFDYGQAASFSLVVSFKA